jgi:SAM-dependent methyltransferase
MPDFVTWCQQNVPGVEFFVNDLQPPLPFAGDDAFDLVLAQSVFTHIPLHLQAAWIKELHRVIRPGGFLMCTVLGRFHQERMLRKEDRDLLAKQGHFTLDAASAQASLSTRLIGSWDVFQTRAEVLRAFGSVFDVRDYLPAELDLLILQKQRQAPSPDEDSGLIGAPTPSQRPP